MASAHALPAPTSRDILAWYGGVRAEVITVLQDTIAAFDAIATSEADGKLAGDALKVRASAEALLAKLGERP